MAAAFHDVFVELLKKLVLAHDDHHLKEAHYLVLVCHLQHYSCYHHQFHRPGYSLRHPLYYYLQLHSLALLHRHDHPPLPPPHLAPRKFPTIVLRDYWPTLHPSPLCYCCILHHYLMVITVVDVVAADAAAAHQFSLAALQIMLCHLHYYPREHYHLQQIDRAAQAAQAEQLQQ